MCFFCKPRCIQTVYVKDDRLVKVDPSPPSIKGGCPRWRVTGEWFFPPDHQVPPQTGQRGVWISNVKVHRSSNGFAEGINNKIKMLKRRGFGFLSSDHFRLRILVACSG